MNIEKIAHKAALEIDRTSKGDVDRTEVIVLKAIRDGITEDRRPQTEQAKPSKKNPNRFYVSE